MPPDAVELVADLSWERANAEHWRVALMTKVNELRAEARADVDEDVWIMQASLSSMLRAMARRVVNERGLRRAAGAITSARSVLESAGLIVLDPGSDADAERLARAMDLDGFLDYTPRRRTPEIDAQVAQQQAHMRHHARVVLARLAGQEVSDQ